jgi:hypothetical protein
MDSIEMKKKKGTQTPIEWMLNDDFF